MATIRIAPCSFDPVYIDRLEQNRANIRRGTYRLFWPYLLCNFWSESAFIDAGSGSTARKLRLETLATGNPKMVKW